MAADRGDCMKPRQLRPLDRLDVGCRGVGPALFAFGSSVFERMLAKAPGLGADELVLDLEDSVAPTVKTEARDALAAFLRGRPRRLRWRCE